MKDLIVAALRRELDGYIRRGRFDRARQVVDQMVLLGCDVSEFLAKLDPSTVPPEEAVKPKPVKKAAARKASNK
jgi:pentatricopeptide repeat protein